jgi:hypothetical protein
MTNKLPVVGKRYRMKYRVEGYDYEVVEVICIKPTHSKTYHIFWMDTNSTMNGAEYLEDFWNKFEELPEDNSQEIKATFQTADEPHLGFNSTTWGDAEDNLQGIEKVKVNEKANLMQLIDKLYAKLWSATEQEPETYGEMFDLICQISKYVHLFDHTQNLMNALEANKKPFFKIREEGYFEGLPPSKEALAKEEENEPKEYSKTICPSCNTEIAFSQREFNYKAAIFDYKTGKWFHSECYTRDYKRKDMSKPEPKIDTKKERVEPVSIWKNVSELPDFHGNIHCLIKFKNRKEIELVRYFSTNDIEGNVRGNFVPVDLKGEFIKPNIKQYCLITDFINSFEQMQKDIEELKKQLNHTITKSTL